MHLQSTNISSSLESSQISPYEMNLTELIAKSGPE